MLVQTRQFPPRARTILLTTLNLRFLKFPTGLARSRNYSQALNTLDASVATECRRYPNMEDEDIRFILGIVEGYQRDLRVYNGQNRRSDCGGCR